MAKTSMIEREKRRAKVVKKYAARRAKIKEMIRDPKASQEDRMAAVEALQKLPRDSSPSRARSRCAITGPLARQLQQVRPRPREAARGDDARRRAGPAQGELVRSSNMSMTDPIADLLTRIRNGQAAGKAEVSRAVLARQGSDRPRPEGRGLRRPISSSARTAGARRSSSR